MMAVLTDCTFFDLSRKLKPVLCQSVNFYVSVYMMYSAGRKLCDVFLLYGIQFFDPICLKF